MLFCIKKIELQRIYLVGIILTMVGLILFFGCPKVCAQEFSNLRIFYQGSLTDSQGNPVEDGRYNMRFSIYDAQEGGNILWQEEYTFWDAVFVKEGKFQVILGRKNPIDLDFEQGPYWLGVAVGEETETGQITWNIGIEPRKKIVTLSHIIEQEELSQKEVEDISQLVEEKLGKQPNLVIVFNLEDIERIKEKSTTSGGFSIRVFQDLLSFLGEKISWIVDKLSEIGEKINQILTKLEGIKSMVVEMARKIDVLYNVLIVDKGLAPKETHFSSPEQEAHYTHKKVERLILKGGEKSVKVFNDLIKENSLIFVSFLDNPGSAWWISEKRAGEFTISLREPAPKDLRFNYWILTEVGEETAPGEIINPPIPEQEEKPLFISTTSQEIIPQSTSTFSATSSLEEIIPPTTSAQEAKEEEKEEQLQKEKEKLQKSSQEATSSEESPAQQEALLPEATSSQTQQETSLPEQE